MWKELKIDILLLFRNMRILKENYETSNYGKKLIEGNPQTIAF
jgi:hypothetical protein